MQLSDYMKDHKLSDVAFAKLIKRDGSTIWRIVHKKTRPDWATMKRIIKVTEGRVMPNDFI